MESFKMPFREIEKIYTKSDLGLMAWRSQETIYQWDKKKDEKPAARNSGVFDPTTATAEEAMAHFGGRGIAFPMMTR